MGQFDPEMKLESRGLITTLYLKPGVLFYSVGVQTTADFQGHHYFRGLSCY